MITVVVFGWTLFVVIQKQQKCKHSDEQRIDQHSVSRLACYPVYNIAYERINEQREQCAERKSVYNQLLSRSRVCTVHPFVDGSTDGCHDRKYKRSGLYNQSLSV